MKYYDKMHYKEEWTYSAAALELTLASYFISQFLRLIVHFYSESHVKFGRLLLLKYAIYSLLYRCIN